MSRHGFIRTFVTSWLYVRDDVLRFHFSFNPVAQTSLVKTLTKVAASETKTVRPDINKTPSTLVLSFFISTFISRSDAKRVLLEVLWRQSGSRWNSLRCRVEATSELLSTQCSSSAVKVCPCFDKSPIIPQDYENQASFDSFIKQCHALLDSELSTSYEISILKRTLQKYFKKTQTLCAFKTEIVASHKSVELFIRVTFVVSFIVDSPWNPFTHTSFFIAALD